MSAKVAKSLVGETKGMLTIIKINSKDMNDKHNHRTWTAVCECGSFKYDVTTSSWNSGRYTSCGCKGAGRDPLPGQKYNSWTVLEKEYFQRKKLFRCRCECGYQGLLAKTDLMRSRSKMCVDCSVKKNIIPNLGSAKNKVYGDYVRNARSRGREFKLSFDEALKLFERNCHYCGSEPMTPKYTPSGTFYYNGIDRVDNDIDYITENVVTCCHGCNFAKASMPYEAFIRWLDQIAKYRSELARANGEED